MSRSRRGLIALLLVLTIPLRAIAAVAMPCGLATEHAESMQMADHAAMMEMANDDDGTTMPSHGGETHTHASFDCCAIAMIALPTVSIASTPYVPPLAAAARPPKVASFITDAPERPPRA
jgi:hypothetical protein